MVKGLDCSGFGLSNPEPWTLKKPCRSFNSHGIGGSGFLGPQSKRLEGPVVVGGAGDPGLGFREIRRGVSSRRAAECNGPDVLLGAWSARSCVAPNPKP